jgi:UDP-N-acetylglucosamine 2-epimerase (non-hydrolysing)
MKVLVVAGARPNFMKVAPIMRSFSTRIADSDGTALLVHTGQHYDASLSGTFFSELGIPDPAYRLEAGSGTHAEQTAKVMIGFERVCLKEKPEWVIVVGDVNSTLACAVTAKNLGISVAHVEAGLRSGDRAMPEEINRRCTDAISDLFFTTERTGDENLMREGVAPDKIHFVGNTMIDTLARELEKARACTLPYGLNALGYAVLTLHRPGTVDDKTVFTRVLESVTRVSKQIPVVFPVHPRTRQKMEEYGLSIDQSNSSFRVMNPLGYFAFLNLMSSAKLVLTDSGGIQEETTVLRVPCLTIRDNTERPITCEIGTNQLVGTDPNRIFKAAVAILDGTYSAGQTPERWDGHAADRIVDVLMAYNSHKTLIAGLDR